MIPISPKNIITWIEKGLKLRDYYAQIKERRTEQLVNPTLTTRRLPYLYEFLQQLYYDLPILVGPDGPFPVGVFPVSDTAQTTIDNLSVQLNTPKTSFPVMNPEIAKALCKRDPKLWNGLTFVLDSIDFEPNLTTMGLHGYLGHYYDMLNSAGYLEYELLATLISRESEFSLGDLPARTIAHSNFESPRECLVSGGGVSAAIAISTLVVYIRDGKYWLLCDVRSKDVAEYCDLYHVIPSFIYQPVTSPTKENLRIERSVVHNIEREYLEEIFSIDEVDRVNRPVDPCFFYKHPNRLFLKRLIENDKAKIIGSGLVFNLINHRPEICSILLIQDESWFQQQADMTAAGVAGLKYLNLNDEFLSNEEQTGGEHLELVTTLPLSSNKWQSVVKPWLMVPPGAPALILGAKYACKIIGIPEPEWLKLYHVEPARQKPAGL